MSERDDKGRFLPGVSGNPSGRPKGVREVRVRASELTLEMLEILAAMARDPEEKATAKVAAIKEILARGVGKVQEAREILLEEGQSEQTAVALFAVTTREDLPEDVREGLERADE